MYIDEFEENSNQSRVNKNESFYEEESHKKIKKVKRTLPKGFVFFCFFLYLELAFKIMIFGVSNIFNIQTLTMILFLIPLSFICSLLCTFFKNKGNFITSIVIFSLFTLLFCVNYVFKKIFNTFFCISLLGLSDQAAAFAGTAVSETIKNIFGVIVLLIPLILIIIFREKIDYKRITIKKSLFYGIKIIASILIFILSLQIGKNASSSGYQLFYKQQNNAMNMEKLGINVSTYLDVKRMFFKLDEEIIINPKKKEEEKPKEKVYEYNNLNIDFPSLIATDTDNTLKTMDEYFANDSGTLQNEYTGLFKDKNLILVMGESFNTIAINKELTPTLYKMANESFVFKNFYTPVNLSTIGGEFQDLTSLFAEYSNLSNYWRKGTNSYPYGLANAFKNAGYQARAYHANSATFQSRNVYLKSIGFDYFLAKGTGLEQRMNCNKWPQSDLDMVNVTYQDYVNDEKFLTYYVSVSGHMQYGKSDSAMVSKNWDLVKDLPYSSQAKGYLAANIELDRAMESLINNLEAAGKLDDTVIAIVADHYPYGLSLNEVNELSDYQRDDTIEINHSTFILWNNKTEKKVIDKVCNQLDAIPTLYNLFGISYDSRLFMGKDILSTEPGLAFFTNRSWVTDKGKYFASNNRFVPNEGVTVDDEYINQIKNTVANRINMSKLIIQKNYYNHVFK